MPTYVHPHLDQQLHHTPHMWRCQVDCSDVGERKEEEGGRAHFVRASVMAVHPPPNPTESQNRAAARGCSIFGVG